MLTRRRMASLAASSAFAPALAVPASGAPGSFEGFLRGVRAEAQPLRHFARHPAAGAWRACSRMRKVLELDRNQPEFTMTWERVPRPDRLAAADRATAGRRGGEIGRCCRRSRAGSASIPASSSGIWGLESNFGTRTGSFNVVEALATLAWEGRRAGFFRSQLMDSLRILDHRDITPRA